MVLATAVAPGASGRPKVAAPERLPMDPSVAVGSLENGVRWYVHRDPSPAGRIRAGTTSRQAQRYAYDRHFSPPVVGNAWCSYFETPVLALKSA